jgi:hypothetical protein
MIAPNVPYRPWTNSHRAREPKARDACVLNVHGETILFNGGSLAARYWKETLAELGESILASGFVTRAVHDEMLNLLDNREFWTWQNSYVTTSAKKSS